MPDLKSKIKCAIIGHDWFTEVDRNRVPLFRICQCCGKYQQPIMSQVKFIWAEIQPGTITAKVLKERAKIETNLIQAL